MVKISAAVFTLLVGVSVALPLTSTTQQHENQPRQLEGGNALEALGKAGGVTGLASSMKLPLISDLMNKGDKDGKGGKGGKEGADGKAGQGQTPGKSGQGAQGAQGSKGGATGGK